MATYFSQLSSALQSFASLGTDVAMKGFVLLFVVALVGLLLKRRLAASSLHQFWTLTLAVLVAMPLLTCCLPRWSLPGLARPDRLQSLLPVVDLGPSTETTPPSQSGELTLSSNPRNVPTSTSSASAQTEWATEPPPAVSELQLQLPLGLVLWFVGVVLLGGWFTLLHGTARWTTSQAREWPADATQALVQRLAARLGVRQRVRLLQGAEHSMPMTWGFLRPVLLLPRDATSWPEDRLQHVVLHELSHVRRGDSWTRLLAQVACTLHWFNPLAWYATQRMTLESEHACDDCVLRTGARPSDYAENLLEVARSLRARTLQGAFAMAGRSTLRERLVAVLDVRRRRNGPGWRTLVTALLLLGSLTLPLASLSWTGRVEIDRAPIEPMAFADPHPAPRAPEPPEPPLPPEPPMPPMPPLPPEAPDVFFDDGGAGRHGTWQIQTDTGLKLRLETQGEIDFGPSGTEIRSITDEGFFDLRYDDGKERYRIRLEEHSGKVEKRYWAEGKERPFDAEAQQHLDTVLPILFREAGYMSGAWVQRTLDSDGVDGVLREVEKIESDFVTRKILLELERRADLNPKQLTEVFELASRKIASDFELSALLAASAKTQPFDSQALVAYCRAASRIESDFETARALTALMQAQELDREALKTCLEAAAHIASDFELSRTLVALLDTQHLDGPTVPVFLQILQGVDSDFEMRRVAQYTAAQHALDAKGMTQLVRLAGAEIGSDFELAQFLVQVAREYDAEGELREALMDAADGIDSSYESRRVLAALNRR